MTDPKVTSVTPLADLIDLRLSRRAALKGFLAGAGGAALVGSGLANAASARNTDASSFHFEQPPHTIEHYQQVRRVTTRRCWCAGVTRCWPARRLLIP